MPIRFACPGCGKPVEVPDALAGRKGRCPGCSTVFDVPNQSDPTLADDTQHFDDDLLNEALRAFKKRLKVTRLDDESKLDRGAFSSGRKEQGMGIQPPGQFPREVWEALVARGDLRRSPGGLYELA